MYIVYLALLVGLYKFSLWFLDPYLRYRNRRKTKEYVLFERGQRIEAKGITPYLLDNKKYDVDLTLVVPAYNEADTVRSVVRSIGEAGFDVVVIDDGSSDRTAQEAADGGASVIRLPFNLGVGGALRCGFRWAVTNGYSVAVQCDADGQHDPDELRRLVDTAATLGTHLLVGSRFIGDDGFRSNRIRRVPMRALSAIASRAANSRISDSTSGFRVISEPLLSEFARAYPVHYLADTFEVLVQAGRCGYTVRETGVTMRPRGGGTPSTGTTASMRYLARSLIALAIGSSHRYARYSPGEATWEG
jgi:NAD(P)-dependent dehydrogenase (short-subunit alcohol dehydrogenase family)